MDVMILPWQTLNINMDVHQKPGVYFFSPSYVLDVVACAWILVKMYDISVANAEKMWEYVDLNVFDYEITLSL
jgi:hypothetical protein